MVGSKVAHYRVVAELGKGGMGVVYKAEDTRLGRTVALKFLPEELARDQSALERFQREARTASALNHPHICTIYQLGEHDGRAFIAMEFLEGETLRDRIAGRPPLSTGEVIELAAQIADGLDAAHRRGIIHRDIKPANIFVSSRTTVKILDFGLAKLVSREPVCPDGATRSLTVVTTPGTALGTIAYMSPEQARGLELDARTDLFSFGVVLYEMATGKLPFPGDTAASIFEGILTKAPAAAEMDGELARVIAKALEKDREVRAQTAAELRADLKRLQRGSAAAATPAPSPLRQARVWWAAAAGCVGLAVAAWALVARHVSPPSWNNATFTQLTTESGPELYPSLSPDGKSLVYVSRAAASNFDIYLKRVGGKNPINLTKESSAHDTQPAFSPDGEQIVFRSDRDGGGIFIMGATGESVRRVADSGYNPAWSPDGQQIVYATGGFHRLESRAGKPRSQLFILPAAVGSPSAEPRLISDGIDDALQPSWSPGGQRIAFWGVRGGNRDIWTIPAGGGTAVQVTNEPATDLHPVWSSDGKYLYFLSNRGGSMNLWRVRIDESSGRVMDAPEQVTIPSAYTSYFSFARDGRRLAYVNQSETGNIYRVDFDPVRESVTGQPVAVTHDSWLALGPHVSPDGQWLAFSTWKKPFDLFVSRADGSALRQLTDDEHRDNFPRWSPDGKRLAFMSNRSGTTQIWTIAPDGSGLRQLTYLRGPGWVPYPVWSPDGARLAFSGDRSTVIMEVAKPWDERSLELLPMMAPTEVWFSAFSWSPDGRLLAGTLTGAAGSAGVSVYSFDTRQYRRFTDFGALPCWLSDGRRLLFWRSSSIYLLDTHSGKAREILSVAPSGVRALAPSPDARHVYFGLQSDEADIWLAQR